MDDNYNKADLTVKGWVVLAFMVVEETSEEVLIPLGAPGSDDMGDIGEKKVQCLQEIWVVMLVRLQVALPEVSVKQAVWNL